MVSDSIFLCRSRTSTPSPAPRLCYADVVAMVRDLDATWWTNQSDDDLVGELVEQLAELRAVAAAVEAGAVAEADAPRPREAEASLRVDR